jgi:transcriptional regulator with XRE-family HTH domain
MDFNIIQLRKEKGLSQGEIAKRVGVTLMSYQIWERGHGKPNEENLVKLKEVLGVK